MHFTSTANERTKRILLLHWLLHPTHSSSSWLCQWMRHKFQQNQGHQKIEPQMNKVPTYLWWRFFFAHFQVNLQHKESQSKTKWFRFRAFGARNSTWNLVKNQHRKTQLPNEVWRWIKTYFYFQDPFSHFNLRNKEKLWKRICDNVANLNLKDLHI